MLDSIKKITVKDAHFLGLFADPYLSLNAIKVYGGYQLFFRCLDSLSYKYTVSTSRGHVKIYKSLDSVVNDVVLTGCLSFHVSV